jgi:hypothetical protein
VADVEAIAAGDHDVQQKERGRLALGVGNEVGGGVKEPRRVAGCLQVMLHQTRDVGVVFQNKNGLAQPVSPRRRPLWISSGGRTEL